VDTIRVLHVIGSSKFGGASAIILGLAEVAKREGWEVDILATDPVFQEKVRGAGIGLVALNGINREIRPLADLRGLWRLWRFLRAKRYTIVHTHTSKGGFLGRLAAKLAGVPVVVHTAHGFAIHEASPVMEKIAYVALERLASSWCDEIVCVSEFHRDWGSQLGLARDRKLVAIPNGIQRQRCLPALPPAQVRESLGIAPETFAILCPSRLAPQKGIEDLLHAVLRFKGLLEGRFHVYLAGEGPAQEEYKALSAQLGLSDLVTFLGFRDDIPNLLAAADLVVLPSIREGLSISLLEAMAASKPIVATSIGSNREVQSALLVEPGNRDELASAIVRMYQDRNLAAQLGQNAGLRFRQHYTEETMLQDYRRLYLRLLSSKRALPAAAPPAREWQSTEERKAS